MPGGQTNKPFKSRHATQGAQKRLSKGRVAAKAKNLKNMARSNSLSKDQRRLQSQQKSQNSRLRTRTAQRSLAGAPKLIALIPLSSSAANAPASFVRRLVLRVAESSGHPLREVPADWNPFLTRVADSPVVSYQPTANLTYVRIERFNTSLGFSQVSGKDETASTSAASFSAASEFDAAGDDAFDAETNWGDFGDDSSKKGQSSKASLNDDGFDDDDDGGFSDDDDDDDDMSEAGTSTSGSRRRDRTARRPLPKIGKGGSREPMAVLELAKSADVVAFLMAPELIDGEIVFADEEGEAVLSLLKAHGLSSVCGLFASPTYEGAERDFRQYMKHSKKKHRSGSWSASLLASSNKFLQRHFGDDVHRVLDSSTGTQLDMVARMLCEVTPRPPSWRQRRHYIVADKVEYNPSNQRLAITGYVRGNAVSPDQVVMLPGFPRPFRIAELAAYVGDPCKSASRSSSSSSSSSSSTSSTSNSRDILYTCKPSDRAADPCPEPPQEYLDDLMAQPAPAHFDSAYKVHTRIVPKGTSSYQATWIPDDHEHSDLDGSDDDDDDDDFLRRAASSAAGQPLDDLQSEADFDVQTETGMDLSDLESDSELDDAEEPKTLEELAAEDLEFPDEMDTPQDRPAELAFRNYRGLASFRSTPWNPRENLPLEYTRVFRFQNFKRTSRYVRYHSFGEDDADKTFVSAGRYCRMVLDDVPADAMPAQFGEGAPFVATALLEHENQPSVLHFAIRRHPGYEGVVKSKALMEFHCGFRTFRARGIFSQNLPGQQNHKLERFLHSDGRDVIVSVYAPIIFPALNVLVFAPESEGQAKQLMATGSLHSVDPDRIILKKVVLSGHPLKIRRRKAIIRKMFFNPNDIRYFKPVKLRTKYGRTGHILEPLGTHGHMKCVFDAPLEQRDTVLLNLYKRAYPVWDEGSCFTHE